MLNINVNFYVATGRQLQQAGISNCHVELAHFMNPNYNISLKL